MSSSSYSRQELEQRCRKIHLDLNDAMVKVRELMQVVASLPIAAEAVDAPACPHCGPLGMVRTSQQLGEHLENVHGVTR